MRARRPQGNGLVLAVLRSPAHRLLSGTAIELSYTGRRSGPSVHAARAVRPRGEPAARGRARSLDEDMVAKFPDPTGGQRVVALLAALTAVENRLRQLGDDHWADWLRRDRERVARGDAYGLEHLKQAFGGMGSINDAYPGDNADIGNALGEIYGLAARLLADHHISDGQRG
jgi:hypothetical protein